MKPSIVSKLHIPKIFVFLALTTPLSDNIIWGDVSLGKKCNVII